MIVIALEAVINITTPEELKARDVNEKLRRVSSFNCQINNDHLCLNSPATDRCCRWRFSIKPLDDEQLIANVQNSVVPKITLIGSLCGKLCISFQNFG